MSGYKVLPKGSKVGFVLKGRLVEGEVVSNELDPNRKPGIGRVTYVVKWHSMYENVRVPASKVHPLEEGTPTENRKVAEKLFGNDMILSFDRSSTAGSF